jgi:hypothetical protein
MLTYADVCILTRLAEAAVMPSLVRTLTLLTPSALERAVVLVSRLMMLPGALFAKQVCCRLLPCADVC